MAVGEFRYAIAERPQQVRVFFTQPPRAAVIPLLLQWLFVFWPLLLPRMPRKPKTLQPYAKWSVIVLSVAVFTDGGGNPPGKRSHRPRLRYNTQRNYK
jgi:hypothetical protein